MPCGGSPSSLRKYSSSDFSTILPISLLPLMRSVLSHAARASPPRSDASVCPAERMPRVHDRRASRAIVEALACIRRARRRNRWTAASCAAIGVRRVDLAAERGAAGKIAGCTSRGACARCARPPPRRRTRSGRRDAQDRRARLRHRRRRQHASPWSRIMADLAEDPRPTLRGAADHQRVGAGVVEHEPRASRRCRCRRWR